MNLSAIKDEYPFKSNFLQIGPHKLHYIDEPGGTEGDKVNGETILMLHGNPTWSFYYRKLALNLRKKYRVIAPDHIGCGLSDKPQDYPYNLQTHIDNLSRLIDEKKLDKITLTVHDWGGAIGFGWAVKNPERVKRLIVFNTAAFRASLIPFSINICRIPVFGDVVVRGFNAFARSAIDLGFATSKPERFTKEVREGYLAPYDSWQNRIAILRFVQDIPLEKGHPSYKLLESIETGLDRLAKKPMLIMWGMNDFCFTTLFLEMWMRRFPDARVHKIENAGHYVVEDAYERIIPQVRDFMETTP